MNSTREMSLTAKLDRTGADIRDWDSFISGFIRVLFVITHLKSVHVSPQRPKSGEAVINPTSLQVPL